MKGKVEPTERQRLIEEGKNLKEQLLTLEEDLMKLTDVLQQEAQCIPNMTHPDVPIGGEDDSAIRKTVGEPREFTFSIKDHVQLGKELDLFDFDAAAENPRPLMASANSKRFESYKQNNEPMLFSEPDGLFRRVTASSWLRQRFRYAFLHNGYGSDSGMLFFIMATAAIP
ncbi:serine--tRNA ligase, chloroplastic/mitochondrial isoform X2, partial [Tanacetum coccineum]